MYLSLQYIALDGDSLTPDDLIRLGKGFYDIKANIASSFFFSCVFVCFEFFQDYQYKAV